MKRIFMALAAVIILAGCTPGTLVRAALTGDEVFDAAKARGVEIVVERQDLRAEGRRADAAIRQVWWDEAGAKRSLGDTAGAVAAYQKIKDSIRAVYPDLVTFIEELDAISDAVKAARADDS